MPGLRVVIHLKPSRRVGGTIEEHEIHEAKEFLRLNTQEMISKLDKGRHNCFDIYVLEKNPLTERKRLEQLARENFREFIKTVTDNQVFFCNLHPYNPYYTYTRNTEKIPQRPLPVIDVNYFSPRDLKKANPEAQKQVISLIIGMADTMQRHAMFPVSAQLLRELGQNIEGSLEEIGTEESENARHVLYTPTQLSIPSHFQL